MDESAPLPPRADTSSRVRYNGDFDADGTPDFYAVAYADEYSSGASDAGIVYLVPGDFDKQLLTGSDDYVNGVSTLGYRVTGAGGINNDVYDDTILGAPYASIGGSGAGEVYVIAGRSAPISSAAGTSAFANYWGAGAAWAASPPTRTPASRRPPPE